MKSTKTGVINVTDEFEKINHDIFSAESEIRNLKDKVIILEHDVKLLTVTLANLIAFLILSLLLDMSMDSVNWFASGWIRCIIIASMATLTSISVVRWVKR